MITVMALNTSESTKEPVTDLEEPVSKRLAKLQDDQEIRVTEVVEGNKIKCLSKTRDFDDIASIHIKDEDKPLTVKNTTVFHQFSVKFRTSEVTVGPAKLKTKPQNDERFALKAGIIEAALKIWHLKKS